MNSSLSCSRYDEGLCHMGTLHHGEPRSISLIMCVKVELYRYEYTLGVIVLRHTYYVNRIIVHIVLPVCCW